MEYKWTVDKLKVAENNLVVNVELRVTGVDGNASASVVYSRDLVGGNGSIPFEHLTEQQVIDWCFQPQVIDYVDSDDVAQTSTILIKDMGEANVAAQIARQLAQAAAEPALPWIPVAQQ